MDIGRIQNQTSKITATRQLAERLGIKQINPRSDEVTGMLETAEKTFGRLNNEAFSIRSIAELPQLKEQSIFLETAYDRDLPDHRNGMPPGFAPYRNKASTVALKVLTLEEGCICHIADAPLVITRDKRAIVREYSSRYAGLIHFYEHSLLDQLNNACTVDGTAVIISDDIRPANYCHWMVDWLPRLAFLGDQARQPDTYVITMPLTTPYQMETLRMCGFSENRIITLKPFQGVRAKKLLVPNDLRKVPHPAHKGASWALEYLRRTFGPTETSAGRRLKLYLSRNDASYRRIANETDLIKRLEKFGYIPVTLSKMSVVEQAAIFSKASHIVGLHGAGLTNIIFADRSTQITEIFPSTYGTPAFYILASCQGSPYASYVSGDVIESSRPQADDLTIDIEDFTTHCGDLL